MHHDHFDTLTRAVARVPSRRDLLRGLAGLGLGLGLTQFSEIAETKKRKHKRKRTKRKPKVRPNEFGCFEVGDPCRSEADCCSGICEGKRCRAHDTGTCEQGVPGYCQTSLLELDKLMCNNDKDCYCLRTTAGSNFCADIDTPDTCAACQRDSDCEAQGFPPGSACAPVTERHCAGACESGMVCQPPCGSVP
jgi:hypothetical protein